MKINDIYTRKEQEYTYLCANVEYGNECKEIWFAVEEQYEAYLTTERSDAFVVGLLTVAMRLGEDVECTVPVTKRLLYQLNHYLIPSLSANIKEYQNIKVNAPTSSKILPCSGAVATGWTGGVDSMYTAMRHLNISNDGYRLTHLLIANNGALESDDNTGLLKYMVNKAREGIAKDYGISVIGVESNIQTVFSEPYLAVAAYRLPAVVLAVQKLFGVFLNSAGYEFSKFAFVPENSAYYELLPLSMFETDCTVFYSACGSVSRIQKLKELADYPAARKYLHPCIYAKRDNCCTCGKCIRTMSALYALGELDNFSEVFDVKQFYAKKDWYLANILAKKESQHYGEVAAVMKQKGLEFSPEAKKQARIMRMAAAAAKKHQNDLI